MHSQFTHLNFKVESALPETEAKQLIEEYLSGDCHVVQEFKNNKHNYIARLNTQAINNLIVKVPRNRNGRIWERIMTLLRPGESMRVYKSHRILNKLKFRCPEPVLAAEFRSFGMVTDSFLIYRYLDGEPARSADAALVAAELQQLHSKGYIRGDPKAENFLVNNGRVYFIDFKLSKPRMFRRHATRMEYAHFLHTMPEGIHYLTDEERNSLGFRFATWLRRAISNAKRKKHGWRNSGWRS